IVITRIEQIDDASSVKEEIQRLVGPTPVFTSRLMTSGIRTIAGQRVHKESVPQPVAAFCGVGNPGSFFNHLRGEGCAPAFTRTFPDHHNYTQSELDQLVNDAKAHGARSLITTAKDAIKLTRCKFNLSCYVLDIQISIDDEDRLVELIHQVCRRAED
ncbi:MAG TPA: tetraacyldisaccharide 4'-kinase, partial [Pyrinomonadaceae bacterium]|nr:tetraacyldisaccharide 4'-kinase [Pyrinomonadaceae bacterium]